MNSHTTTGAAFVAAAEAELDTQRTPPPYGAPKADALMAVVDQGIRAKWGPLPWVRYTRPGRVLSVNAAAHTCTVRIADDGGPGQPDVSAVRTVRTGFGTPTVGRTYAVHFPYKLPDEPTSLLTGPVPAGDPWLKAPGGSTWLYYVGRTPANALAWYRVPLPPAGDTSFQYAADAATLIAQKEGTSFTIPPWGFWGGETLTGVTQTYFTNHLWMEDSHWSNNLDTLRGIIPTTQRPQRAIIRSYGQLGADPDLPGVQDTGPYTTTYPWMHLAGSNIDFAADQDYLLGFHYSLEVLPNPVDNPAYQVGQLYQIHIKPANSVGAAAWTERGSTPPMFGTKLHAFFDTVNGYHVGSFRYTGGELADACGWTATATHQWANTGQRISYWAVQQLTPDPFPDPRSLVPLDQPTFLLDRYNECPSRIRVFVALDSGAAVEVTLPGQPPGWVEPYPGFFLRPSGGTTIRCWWAGMPSFVQTQPGGPGTPIVNTATPVRLWRGEIDLQGLGNTWGIQDGALGLNKLVAVNGDASIVAAVKATAPTGSTPGANVAYLTQDAGATWTAIPPPPHVTGWGVDVPRMRLIDTL